MERGRLDLAPGEELMHIPGVRVGEGHQGLLDPAQVERRLALAHGLFQALDVAVDILVQQLQEQAEVVRVALVGRGGHEEEVVGHLGEMLTELIGQRLLVRTVGAHLVGLVHDDEVPVAAQQALAGILDAGDPGDGGHHLVAFLPGVHAVVGTQGVAADDLELLAELVAQLALPLKGQVGRGNDQDALDQPADLQLLDEEPGHDGLASTGVVRQQEADAGQPHEVVVDGFELVGQRIDACDGEAEVGVVLVGKAQTHRLDTEAETLGIAIEGAGPRAGSQERDLFLAEDRIVELAGRQALPHDLGRFSHRNDGHDPDRFRDDGASDDGAGLELAEVHGFLHARRSIDRR